MNSKVFISYSSVDDKLAKQLAKTLDEINIEYFFDRKEIEWGDDVTDRITEGLAQCSALIVIISPASLKSQWVPFEIGHASGLGKKILPFLTHPSLDVPGYLQKFHHKTRLADVKKYLKTLFQPPSPKKETKPGAKVSPKERDAIRAERNEMLKNALEQQDGIRDCSFIQLDDHTDNGYLANVKFNPEVTSAGHIVSSIRATFDEMFPDIPIWGEMKTEDEESVGFAYTYIDEYNKVFK